MIMGERVNHKQPGSTSHFSHAHKPKPHRAGRLCYLSQTQRTLDKKKTLNAKMPRLCIEHTRLPKIQQTNKQLYKYMCDIYIYTLYIYIYIRIHTSIYSIHNIQTYTESIKNQSLVVPSLTTQLQQHEQGEHHCCEAHRDEVCTNTNFTVCEGKSRSFSQQISWYSVCVYVALF